MVCRHSQILSNIDFIHNIHLTSIKKIVVSWKSQISKKPSPQYFNENSPKLNYTIKRIDFLEHDLKNEHYLNNHLCSSKCKTVAECCKNLYYHYVIHLSHYSCRPTIFSRNLFPRNLTLALSSALMFEVCNNIFNTKSLSTSL